MTTKIIQEKLSAIQNYLESGNPEKALCLLDNATQPELINALGVCLMRLNKIDPALRAFRDIIFQNSICIPTTTPTLYKANYVTALLLKGFVQTALDIEKTLNKDGHPYVTELKRAVRNWKQSLPWYQRLLCYINRYPNKPLTLPFAPGGV